MGDPWVLVVDRIDSSHSLASATRRVRIGFLFIAFTAASSPLPANAASFEFTSDQRQFSAGGGALVTEPPVPFAPWNVFGFPDPASSLRQDSRFGASWFSGVGSAGVEGFRPVGAVGGLDPQIDSVGAFTFRVLEPVRIHIDATISSFNEGDPIWTATRLRLASGPRDTLLSFEIRGTQEVHIRETLLLDPGGYSLWMSAFVQAEGDLFTVSSSWDALVRLPESGPVLHLILSGIFWVGRKSWCSP